MRKRLLTALLAGAIAVLPVFFGSRADALSVAYCNDDTIECKVQNCRTDNAVREWDGQVSGGVSAPLKDCLEFERRLRSQNKTGLLIYAVLTPVVAASLYLMHRTMFKKSPAKKK